MLRDRMSSSLKRFISKNHGGTIDIIDTKTGKTFNPSTQTVTGADTTVTVDCTAPVPISSILGAGGSGASIGDLETFVHADDAALTFVPRSGMEADYDSERYALARVITMAANGSAYGYHLFLRGLQ